MAQTTDGRSSLEKSTASTPATSRRGSTTRWSIEQDQPLDWSSPQDAENPLNWPKSAKVYQTAVISLIGLVSTLASSIITPGLEQIQDEFSVSAEVSLLPYILYSLGLSIGPLIAGPLSESFGRRNVYRVSVPVFALFILGAGFSQSIASLSICRFLAGAAASPGLTIGGATLSDVWEPKDRAIPYALFVTSPFLGPALGPLIGGYLVPAQGWRWTQWIVDMIAALTMVLTCFMRETHKPTVLRRRAAQQMRHETLQGISDPSHTPSRSFSHSSALKEFATTTVFRPFHMGLVEPVVGFFTLYIAINFGILYAFFAAFPYIFQRAYAFGPHSTGLMFLGLVAGVLLGTVIMILWSKSIMPRLIARAHKQENARGRGSSSESLTKHEARLYLAMFGSVLLPVSLFWFGWTVHYRAHWINAVIAEALFGCGNLLIFMSATLYVLNFYGPRYGASANAVNGFVRYLICAAFPLFIVQMYRGLGTGWASSVLGFVSVVTMFIPWVLYRQGPRMRERSQYIKGFEAR